MARKKLHAPLRVILFCCLALMLAVGQARGADQHVRVAKCYDGDTVRLADGRTVRLAGIDSPETRKPDAPGQYYAARSAALLASLAEGRRVRLVWPEGENFRRDSHKRVVAEIYLENGASLNEIMLAEGAAFAYPHPEHPEAFSARLLKAQRAAMAHGKGFWKRILSEDFARRPYMGNRNSKRFFPLDCPEKERVAMRNRVNFASLKDAFAAGYAPARMCLFWPEE